MSAKNLRCFLSAIAFVVACGCQSGISYAQRIAPNYDESKVPQYKLPDLLMTLDGKKVKSAKDWTEVRRPEILELFQRHVYGRLPDVESEIKWSADKTAELILQGAATMRNTKVTVGFDGKSITYNMLVFLPAKARAPVPLFLGYNFHGNHTVLANPNIKITDVWVRNQRGFSVLKNRAVSLSRGMSASRWPIKEIIARGYGVATIYYGEVDPDFDDGFKNGIHPVYDNPRWKKRPPEAWGSISGWAWGLKCALVCLEQDQRIDAKKIAVIGHSRLGKTALWAGAIEEGFALVISNNSGCGGAALSRREFGETVKRINTTFPHWFCDNFVKYNNKIKDCPVDQHMLIALMAPRPVYIASATEDRWADPQGEFLAGKNAQPVYDLFSKKGLGDFKMPEPNQSIGDTIGYHVRNGKHDITLFDWQRYMDFADRHFKTKNETSPTRHSKN
jgi:hypothetical protein